MNCRTARRLIDLLVGHDLNDIEAAEVRLHLTECSRCAGQFEQSRQCHLALETLQEAARPSASLDADDSGGSRVWPRVQGRLSEPEAGSFWPLRLRDVAGFVTLVSACVIVAAIPQWRAERWNAPPVVVPATFHREAAREPDPQSPELPPGRYRQVFTDQTWEQLHTGTARRHVDPGSL